MKTVLSVPKCTANPLSISAAAMIIYSIELEFSSTTCLALKRLL